MSSLMDFVNEVILSVLTEYVFKQTMKFGNSVVANLYENRTVITQKPSGYLKAIFHKYKPSRVIKSIIIIKTIISCIIWRVYINTFYFSLVSFQNT